MPNTTVIASPDMCGVDSAQALLMALLTIGERLAAESDQFTYLGLKGTGFPRHLDLNRPGVSAWVLPWGDS